jgi:hypothetical protein
VNANSAAVNLNVNESVASLPSRSGKKIVTFAAARFTFTFEVGAAPAGARHP